MTCGRSSRPATSLTGPTTEVLLAGLVQSANERPRLLRLIIADAAVVSGGADTDLPLTLIPALPPGTTPELIIRSNSREHHHV